MLLFVAFVRRFKVCIHTREFQIDDCVFQNCLNFVKKLPTGSINNIGLILLFTYITSWHVKFAKLRPLWKALEKARSSTVDLTPSNPLTSYLYPGGFRKA